MREYLIALTSCVAAATITFACLQNIQDKTEDRFNVGECGYYINEVDFKTGQPKTVTMTVLDENEKAYKLLSDGHVYWTEKQTATVYKKVDCKDLE